MNAAFAQFAPPSTGFRHEALIYAGDDAFVGATLPFIEAGIDAGEPVLVALCPGRNNLLREALGADATSVMFADMTELGQNPARLIPAWRDFVSTSGAQGKARRGLSEPMWAGRSDVELIECARHESLLNIAFGDSENWWLLCPFDAASLDDTILEEALRSHPLVLIDGQHELQVVPPAEELASAQLAAPLPEPRKPAAGMSFGPTDLRDVREYVAKHTIDSGMDAERAFDLLVAVSEVATNSIVHGGGLGSLRIWHDDETVVCEFADSGVIDNPMVGRVKPDDDAEGQRGLWLANQLCDLVQLRVYDQGTVIRLHKKVHAA